MIEYAVKHYADTVFMELFADASEAFIISETVVYIEIIIGIISMGSGHEYRSEVNGIDIHFLQVRNKIYDLIKTMFKLTVIDTRCTAEAKRIDVIEYGFVYPIHLIFFPFAEN